MVRGAALDGQGDLLPGIGLGLFLVVGLDLLELDGLLMGDLVGQPLDQIGLGLLGGQAAQPLQQVQLALLEGFDLLPGLLHRGQPGLELLLFLLDGVGLAVQVVLLLLKAALLLLQVGPALLDLGVEVGALSLDGLLGRQNHLPLLGLRLLDGHVDNTGGLLFGGADLLLRIALADLETGDNADQQTDHAHDNGNDNCDKFHITPPKFKLLAYYAVQMSFAGFFCMKKALFGDTCLFPQSAEDGWKTALMGIPVTLIQLQNDIIVVLYCLY